jgi:hypothetical protein
MQDVTTLLGGGGKQSAVSGGQPSVSTQVKQRLSLWVSHLAPPKRFRISWPFKWATVVLFNTNFLLKCFVLMFSSFFIFLIKG